MHAKQYTCRVLENIWITPTVMRIRFEPLKHIKFFAGQFLSLIVPPQSDEPGVKRCYSFSSSPAEAKEGYYELCVKYVSGGKATSYFSSLRKGDTFLVQAPYGDLRFKKPEEGRAVCFIATGSGIAPFRSMILSEEFQTIRPETLVLFGARTENEILYQHELEKAGAQYVPLVSQPTAEWQGPRGRVTDYLKSLPVSWNFHQTDFYLCGNGEMVNDIYQFLCGSKGVNPKSIKKEAFSLPQRKTERRTDVASPAPVLVPIGVKQAA